MQAGVSYEYGTVLWFDGAKGLGFLSRDGNAGDVFMGARAMPAGSTAPGEGDRVKFVLERRTDGRYRAASVTVISS
jgi:cold shock CspA family protein